MHMSGGQKMSIIRNESVNMVRDQNHGHAIAVLLLLALTAPAGIGCAGAGGLLRGEPASIRAANMAGRRAYVLENEFYRAVLVPEIARFPLSLVYKPSGNEFFAQPVSLDTPNVGFQAFGGIVDSLPWVSGKHGGKRLADKGFLFSVPWETASGATRNTAWFEGRAEIEYEDLLDGTTSRLAYVKRVTGSTGSPNIVMEQTIRNVGNAPARFMITLHARTAIAGYTAGDYLYVPGDRAEISYMRYPELSARGIDPPQEIDWPLPEAVTFQPSAEARHVFVFTPADWGVAGSEKTGEALVFRGGEVSSPDGIDRVKMALFMTGTGYLLEPGLTSCIVANEENWAVPGNTVRLEPGQECNFTVTMIPVSGVRRADWPDAFAQLPE